MQSGGSSSEESPDDVQPVDVPRFDLSIQSEEILSYIEVNGYVVVRNVLNEGEIGEGKRLFWDFICRRDENIDPKDISTWNKWPGDSRTGIISGDFNHSEFLWFTRLHPKVKAIFSLLWNTEELLTSFDAGNAFRPWQHEPKYKTSGGWWHVDQNCLRGPERQGKVSIQGLVTFYDADETTGGFAAIPGSHHHHTLVCQLAPRKIDFVPILDDFPPELRDLPKILPRLKAGDMILWDSRCVHCNVPALNMKPTSAISDATITAQTEFTSRQTPDPAPVELLRLVSYICMQPKSMASKRAIETKRLAMLFQIPTSHWATNEIDPDLLEFFVTHITNVHRQQIRDASAEKLKMCGFSEQEIATRKLAGDKGNAIFSSCVIQ